MKNDNASFGKITITAAVSIVVVLMLLPAVSEMVRSAELTKDFGDNKFQLRSPNGRYTIRSEHRCLFIQDGKTPQRKLNLPNGTNQFERTAGVVWAPDSSAFILNDWMGPETVDAYLYKVIDLSHADIISNKLKHLAKSKVDKRTFHPNGGLLVFVDRWRKKESFEIEVCGLYLVKPGYYQQLHATYLWDLNLSMKRIRVVAET
jgi:hypothetical protein